MGTQLSLALLLASLLLASVGSGTLLQTDLSDLIGHPAQAASGSNFLTVVGQEAGKDMGQPTGHFRPISPRQGESSTIDPTSLSEPWRTILAAKTRARPICGSCERPSLGLRPASIAGLEKPPMPSPDGKKDLRHVVAAAKAVAVVGVLEAKGEDPFGPSPPCPGDKGAKDRVEKGLPKGGDL